MPKGSNVQKGMRFGGRTKGTPNRRTVERLEAERIARQAQDEVNKAHIAKVKLAKDVLEDYMSAFHNVAAYYQNRIARAYAAGGEPSKADMSEFEKWGTLTAQTAKNLAEFQSPKFKAIAITAPPPSDVSVANDDARVDRKDPIAMANFYKKAITRRT